MLISLFVGREREASFSALPFWDHRLNQDQGLSPCLPPSLPSRNRPWAPSQLSGSGNWGAGAAFSPQNNISFFPSDPHGQKSKHYLFGCAVCPGPFSKYRNNLDENVVLRWISEDEAINVSHPSLQGSPRGLLSQAGLLPPSHHLPWPSQSIVLACRPGWGQKDGRVMPPRVFLSQPLC